MFYVQGTHDPELASRRMKFDESNRKKCSLDDSTVSGSSVDLTGGVLRCDT